MSGARGQPPSPAESASRSRGRGAPAVVTGEKPASYRDKLVRDGHRRPPLGEQYQMRELLTEGLRAAGYTEHPTMYFARYGLGPEKWKSIMVDQDKQEAEVAIGLGGSSSCRASEAITDVNSRWARRPGSPPKHRRRGR